VLSAPRSRSWIGALSRLAVAVALAGGMNASALIGQEIPDTIPKDTVPVVPVPGADSAQAQAGTEGDSASADTIFYNLPRLDGEVPVGWGTGVWGWDHEAIMASGASTLAELVAEVPGLVVLFGGDYGTPVALSAFGGGGGGVRIVRDGFEVFPLEGGVADLARVGLGGIERVRLDRSAGELRIDMWSKEFDDGRPYSLVEASTGDLSTNVFRGTFAEPTALGGSVALALERTDTQGPNGNEPGNRNGSWLRYQLHRGNRSGIAIDFRRMGTETEVADFPSPVTRTDWAVRARHRLTEGLVAEAYTGKSTHKVEDIRDSYQTEGGSRTQRGVRLAFTRSDIWARGAWRSFGGEAPSSRLDLSAGLSRVGVGGVSADLNRGSWAGSSTSSRRVRAWTEPVFGLSLFGSWESGTHGARTAPLRDIVPPVDTTEIVAEPDSTAPPEEPSNPFSITDRSATRFGASFSWRGATLSGARLRVDADSLVPLGTEPVRGQPVLPGAEHKGWELWGSLPTPMPGLRLVGSLQQWEEDDVYLPRRIYRGAFRYHRTFLDSENLELWWTLGVRGHDPMTVQQLGEEDEDGNRPLQTVPFYQSWYGRIQVRVVTMQIFIGWENFTIRRNLQSFPGRLLPITRSFYGIRWTLWN
jgi:TonB-dependent Receptor Plug Domain